MEARSNGWSSTVCDELYLYLSVAICFSCLISFVCWCNICCFFENFSFLFLFFDDFEWEIKVHWQLLCEVTLTWAVEAATYLTITVVHPSVIQRCTPASVTTLYNLLQYLIRSVLCLIIRHDIIINESLKPDYFSLYVSNLIVSSRNLLKTNVYLCISMNTLGPGWLS